MTTAAGLIGDVLAQNAGGNCEGVIVTASLEDAADGCGATVADPELLPLADNGGLTQTRALATGSPAIGSVPAFRCALVSPYAGDVDQRSAPRRTAERGVCDAGAYDTGGAAPAITSAPSTS